MGVSYIWLLAVVCGCHFGVARVGGTCGCQWLMPACVVSIGLFVCAAGLVVWVLVLVGVVCMYVTGWVVCGTA